MKNITAILTACALCALAGCARPGAEEIPAPQQQYATVTLSTDGTRAGQPLPEGVDADSYHWRYTYEIREVVDLQGTLSPVQYLFQKSTSSSIAVTLVRNKKYMAYVWVDIVRDGTTAETKKTATDNFYYSFPTGTLNEVSMLVWPHWYEDYSQYALRTSYGGAQPVDLVADPSLATISMTATPRTAQVCVIATDMDEMLAMDAKLIPNVVGGTISYYMTCAYNTVTCKYGMFDGIGSSTYDASGFNGYGFPYTAPIGTAALAQGLVMRDDLLVEPGNVGSANRTMTIRVYANYTVKILKDGQLVDEPMTGIPRAAFTLTNIPLQGGYRTNVRGRVLTGTADISVTVDPRFS